MPDKAKVQKQSRQSTPLSSAIDKFGSVALVLQGGGALGAYQCGVYEALSEAGVQPDRITGVSIGAINAALIAGNPPDRRIGALTEFWNTITHQPLLPDSPWDNDEVMKNIRGGILQLAIQFDGLRSMLEGQKGFFRPIGPFASRAPYQVSFYDTEPLRSTLESLIDFDLLNSGAVRVGFGAVDIESGHLTVFDSQEHRITVDHIMASGALPPGFPAVEIEGRYYWDGGIVSNTPLEQIIEDEDAHLNTLVLMVGLWSRPGKLPRTITEVIDREKDIQYASRADSLLHRLEQRQKLIAEIKSLREQLPNAAGTTIDGVGDSYPDARYNVLQLTYRERGFDGQGKDYQFSRAAMAQHWKSGAKDAARLLDHPEWFELPEADKPFVRHILPAR